MTDDKELITRTYNDYIRAFHTLDPRAFAPYYHLPCLVISPPKPVALASSAEVEAYFERVTRGLKARNYARTEFTELRVQPLCAETALLHARGARYKADGEKLQALTATYLFQRTGSDWKIAVIVMHDPATLAPHST
ncbi:MAG: nuclear transport factor 2 family protein [Sulfurifustaceae bacterium]